MIDRINTLVTFRRRCRLVGTTMIGVLVALMAQPALAQWIGDSDYYVARLSSGVAAVKPRANELAFPVGFLPHDDQISAPSHVLGATDPFDMKPLSFRGGRGRGNLGWRSQTAQGRLQRVSPDGKHFSIVSAQSTNLYNAEDPTKSIYLGEGSVIKYLGDSGEHVAIMMQRRRGLRSDMNAFMVKDIKTGEILFKRRFPVVYSDIGGTLRIHPISLGINGAPGNRFVFMRREHGKKNLFVYDHLKRKMFHLPYKVLSLALSSDGSRLGILGANKVSGGIVVDTDTWQIVSYLQGKTPGSRGPSAPTPAAFLMNNRYYLAAPSNQALLLFDTETGLEVDRLRFGAASFMVDPKGELVVFFAGNKVHIWTVKDGRLVETDLCKSRCRVGHSRGGVAALKPDYSAVMVEADSDLVYIDLKTYERAYQRHTSEALLQWLQERRHWPLSLKCVVYYRSCEWTKPNLDRTIDRSALHFKKFVPEHVAVNKAYCDTGVSRKCLSWLYRVVKRREQASYLKRIGEPFVYGEKERRADDQIFQKYVVDTCKKTGAMYACFPYMTSMYNDLRPDEIEAVCRQYADMCGVAIHRMNDLIKWSSNFGFSDEAVSALTEQRIRIAKRACLDGGQIDGCEYVPGYEHVGYYDSRRKRGLPEARKAWDKFLPWWLDYLDKADAANGSPQDTITWEHGLANIQMPAKRGKE